MVIDSTSGRAPGAEPKPRERTQFPNLKRHCLCPSSLRARLKSKLGSHLTAVVNPAAGLLVREVWTCPVLHPCILWISVRRTHAGALQQAVVVLGLIGLACGFPRPVRGPDGGSLRAGRGPSRNWSLGSEGLGDRGRWGVTRDGRVGDDRRPGLLRVPARLGTRRSPGISFTQCVRPRRRRADRLSGIASGGMAGTRRELTIVLGPIGQARGRLTDQEGRPIAGCRGRAGPHPPAIGGAPRDGRHPAQPRSGRAAPNEDRRGWLVRTRRHPAGLPGRRDDHRPRVRQAQDLLGCVQARVDRPRRPSRADRRPAEAAG